MIEACARFAILEILINKTNILDKNPLFNYTETNELLHFCSPTTNN